MPTLVTKELAKQVAALVAEHSVGMVAALYGEDAVSPEEWLKAVDLGLVDPTNPPKTITAQLYGFGIYMSHVDQAQWQDRYGTTAASFIDEITRNPIPMTAYEHKAQEFAKNQAGQFIVGLGNKVGATLGSKLIEADAALDKDLRGTIRDVVSAKFGDDDAAKRLKQRAIDKDIGEDPEEFFDNAFRSSIGRMTSDIGHATNDWARDLKRIANTENQRAVNKGLSDGWQERAEEQAKEDKQPIDRIVVYKIAKPDACKHCIRLHNDASNFPRLFYLDELEGNGSNFGRKAAVWKPTVDPVHPWCACALVKLPGFLPLPKGWRSGQAAPTLIGPGGGMVIPDE